MDLFGVGYFIPSRKSCVGFTFFEHQLEPDRVSPPTHSSVLVSLRLADSMNGRYPGIVNV